MKTRAIYFLVIFIPTLLCFAQDDVLKHLVYQVQFYKSDSSAFREEEAGTNLWGFDVNTNDWEYLLKNGQNDYVDENGFCQIEYDIWTRDLITDVRSEEALLPFQAYVAGHSQNSVDFHIDSDIYMNAELRIFDIKGELVKKISAGEIFPGTNNLSWDCTNNHGQEVVNGIYPMVLVTDKGIIRSALNKDDYGVSVKKNIVKGFADKYKLKPSEAGGLEKSMAEKVFTKVNPQWVVPGYNMGNLPQQDLWIDSDGNGVAEFRDTVKVNYTLPYPTLGKVAPTSVGNDLKLEKDFEYNTDPNSDFKKTE